MKQQATLLTGLTLSILLSETRLSSDLLLFFLVGAIPGTTYSLSSGTMLTLIGIATIVVILQLGRPYDPLSAAFKLFARLYLSTKNQLLKRALGQA